MKTSIGIVYGEATSRPVCESRADRAADFHAMHVIDKVHVTGKPDEKERIAARLLLRGVPKEDIVLERDASDTVDNVVDVRRSVGDNATAVHSFTSWPHSSRVRLLVRSQFPDAERVMHVTYDAKLMGAARCMLELPLTFMALTQAFVLKNGDYNFDKMRKVQKATSKAKSSVYEGTKSQSVSATAKGFATGMILGATAIVAFDPIVAAAFATGGGILGAGMGFIIDIKNLAKEILQTPYWKILPP